MKTIIMAGGKGTRIRSIAPDIPKAMIKIEGKPILERNIDCLRKYGLKDFIITVSYLAKNIMDYFEDGSSFGVNIEYFIERQLLGNAGALFKIQNKLKDDFLLINADTLFDIDFDRFLNFHQKRGGLVTLFAHPNNHPYDSAILITNEDGAVEELLLKEDIRPQWCRNRVNAGLHIINPEILNIIGINSDLIGSELNGVRFKVDLDREILKPLCTTGKIFCYDSPEYIKDIGTPDRYRLVCADYRNGKVKNRNLKNKQKAIFIDRDGTVNYHSGFLRNIDEFRLLPGVIDAIKKINSSDFLTIIVTNQPVIARGEITIHELNNIHNKMETLLGNGGAYLDAIYYCPHHPHRGYRGEISDLKINCNCRKPKPGMLIRAAKDFNIDLCQSWMIGDSKNDIRAGQAAGCHTALIGQDDYGQTILCNSLLEAVEKII